MQFVVHINQCLQLGLSNFYLKSGNMSKEEMISDIKNGILIFQQLMWAE